nr:hypothetical protein [uncultured Anaerosporobacter sp.]
MTKKTLEMHYTTIQTLQEDEVIPRFLTSLQDKFTETAGTSHEIDCTVNLEGKQLTALYDDDIKIIARIIKHNIRSVSLTKMPEVMKIFEAAKKELINENAANSEALSALEQVMHIHGCTVEISMDSTMDRQHAYAAKKLVEQITRNKTIIMLR